MKGDRWTPLRDEAEPKARKYSRSLRIFDAEMTRQVEAAYLRGYLAGATRLELKGWRKRSADSG